MTKRHYEALAAAIVRARVVPAVPPPCAAHYGAVRARDEQILDGVAREVCEVLQAQGKGLFDPERFLAACGVGQ